MKDLRWAPRAQADLADLHIYFREIDPEIALQMTERSTAAARFLSEHPKPGSPVDDSRSRRWRVPRTAFVLIYREAADHIRILRVVHYARDWQRLA